MSKLTRYRTPPKKVFRAMGLGVEKDGFIKVVAGFRFKWWVPDDLGRIEPLFVNARVLRVKKK
jgi:hypothetical protein